MEIRQSLTTSFSFYPFVCLLLCVLMMSACREDRRLMQEVEASAAGISFRNAITETQATNILTYEYTYNGAGVAAGDVNNDGFVDLYFVGNSVPNALYLNRGDWRFEDVSAASGVAGRAGWRTGATMADVNGDGWLDIYVCYSGNAPGEGYNLPVVRDYAPRANQLFINQGCEPGGVPQFREMSQAYGLDAIGTFSTQAYFFDMDSDGDLDMLLLNHANMFYAAFFNTRRLRNLRHPYFGNKLFRNDTQFDEQGKPVGDIHFSDISEQAGIHGSGLNFSLSASLSDLNHDGWTDIYITNDYEEQDFCYINNRDGTFRDESHTMFGHLSKFGMGSDIADINNDGFQDIVVLDMLPEDNRRQKLLKGPDEFDRYQLAVDSGYHHQYMRNTLQLNRGFGSDHLPRFSEIGQLAGMSNTDWSWSPFLVDLDNDGFKDLFVTNGYLRDFTNLDFMKYTGNVMQTARQSNQPVDYLSIVQQLPQTRVRNYVFRNTDGLRFENMSDAWGLSRTSVSNGAVYADLDNDGDTDIVTNDLNDAPTLLRNRATEITGNRSVRIVLKGRAPNTQGMGARVEVRTDDAVYHREAFTARGYASSVDPSITVGVGAADRVASIVVEWPDGTTSSVTNVNAGETVIIEQPVADVRTAAVAGDIDGEEETLSHASARQSAVSSMFDDVTVTSGIRFRHTENNFIDFKSHRLLYYQLSRLGGKMATGDVNGDGNDDVFFGGASGQPGVLYLGTDNGTFVEAPRQPWSAEAAFEDVDALFFDADGDGDPDLYVVSGGNEHPASSALYQDRIYLNNGAGEFSRADGALPTAASGGSVVCAADFDRDGDLDLFVGSHHVPGSYGFIPRSALLMNRSGEGRVRFDDVTDSVNKDLATRGMVTAAVWADINNDSWPDLIISGEWMPIVVFINDKGKLVEYKGAELNDTNGWWTNVSAQDIDGDGDIDFLLGNAGLNMQITASPDRPVQLYCGDFNNDGAIDPLLCYHIMDKSYPLASRDEMLDQMAFLRKKFTRYEEYASATIDDILTPEQIQKSYRYKATTFASVWMENVDGKSFRIHELPDVAQFSCTNAFVPMRLSTDRQVIISGGNFYSYRPQLGRSDASMGVALQYEDGGLTASTGVLSPLWLTGDIRDMAVVRSKAGGVRLLVSRNNDGPSLFRPNK